MEFLSLFNKSDFSSNFNSNTINIINLLGNKFLARKRYEEVAHFNRVCLWHVGSAIIWPGVFFNVLVLLVLRQLKASSSTLKYLQTLAASDILLLLLIFVNHSIWWLVGEKEAMSSPGWIRYHSYFRHWMGILEELVRLVNVWLVTSLSADKYFGICHPYFASSRCTTSTSKRVILGVVGVAFVYKLPRFFESTIQMENGQPRIRPAFSDNFDRYYTYYYRIWLSEIIEFFIPFILLVYLNSRTIWALNRRFRGFSISGNSDSAQTARAFGSNKDDQKARRNVTLVCTVITVTFLIFQFPFYATALYGHIVDGNCAIRVDDNNDDFNANSSSNQSSYPSNSSPDPADNSMPPLWGYEFCPPIDYSANLTLMQQLDRSQGLQKNVAARRFLIRIWILTNISLLALMVSSSVNFFIYVTLSSGFRNSCFEILKPATEFVTRVKGRIFGGNQERGETGQMEEANGVPGSVDCGRGDLVEMTDMDKPKLADVLPSAIMEATDTQSSLLEMTDLATSVAIDLKVTSPETTMTKTTTGDDDDEKTAGEIVVVEFNHR